MKYTEFYRLISRPWCQLRQGATLLNAIDKALVAAIAGAYGVVLVWLLASGDNRVMRVAAIPAVLLVCVSLLRTWLNRPRPYEAFDIQPLLAADTKGRSLPSRHVACAFVIACALWFVNTSWGAMLSLLSIAVAYTRMAGGVHFPRDVAAGAILGLAFGIIGFFIV